MSDGHRITDPDAKTDTGTATGVGLPAHVPETAEFDREINVRSILWTGAALLVLALAVHLLIWWLLRGFESYDEKREVRLTPIEAANPQPSPPGPLLQVSPTVDMTEMREREDQLLNHAGWVDRRQGIVRLPVADAIDLVAARGLDAQVAGGQQNAVPVPQEVP